MIKLKNILAENMRRFKTKNLNEQGSEDRFGLWSAKKSLRMFSWPLKVYY